MVPATLSTIWRTVLALGGAEGAAEILLGDDVGGVLRPGGRELEVALLEGGRAIAQLVMTASLRSQVSSS